jgi:hypothetical protein
MLEKKVVRAAGVEPALLSEQDFESSASTNSTTPAATTGSKFKNPVVENDWAELA